MLNWNTDDKQLLARDPKKFRVWQQAQLINYGLRDGEYLDRVTLLSSWDELRHLIDPLKASVIEYWLWDKTPSLPKHSSDSWTWF